MGAGEGREMDIHSAEELEDRDGPPVDEVNEIGQDRVYVLFVHRHPEQRQQRRSKLLHLLAVIDCLRLVRDPHEP